MNSVAWKYLDKMLALKTLGLILLQQVIAVVGTFAFAQAGFHINNSAGFIMWTSFALASHMLVPLFSILLRPLEIKLTFQSYAGFLDEKLFNKSRQVSIWTEKKQRETFLASLGSETDSYLGAMIYVGLDVFSYVLSLILGVLVLGYIFDSSFVMAFLASGIFSGLCFFFLRGKVSKENQHEQVERTKVSSILLQSWDNIFFNNKNVAMAYENHFHKSFKQSQQQAIKATYWNEGFIGLLSTVSSLPVVLAIILMVTQKDIPSTVLVGLLATIPRQLALLSTFRNLFQSTTSFISFETKFKSLCASADICTTSLTERISPTLITLNDQKLSDLSQIVHTIQNAGPQRITVRGKNGAGKSTLLLELNRSLQDSFYLPSHPQFLDAISTTVSTGQNILAHLRYAQSSNEQILLLDEWDANLDQANIEVVESLLEELSKTKVIVEVRHR